ncbi:hypothetical protein OEW28_18660 [Defluviimonas sp. WL0002]|uniref:Head-tail adaptor protein n=1 Tax=Albidovulum marisflavi TaxID=2984159 RepID=A0ABT2ZHM7_9RHOB|nr:hypothetical protein [Defluviimonas sp. WL0002]MCV2870639.1 hypothetical protein [Defluviimonas sp. WL0002]
MSAMSAAIDRIFADPNMAADALWTPYGSTTPVSCRVIRKAPDEITEFGAAQILSETTIIDVRASEIAAPGARDRVQIGTEVLVVRGAPRRDRERLVWTCEMVPA